MNQYSTDRERTRAAASRWRLSIAIFAAMTALACTGVARADELQIQVGSSQKSASIRLTGGKSETVRTDRTFADVIVSDPEIADVVPLTDRSLSILGKKVGTTRLSVYGGDKGLVGVFDIEVTHDTSVLGTELRERFPNARFRVASVNGRILLSGSAPDAVTVDTAVSIAKHFASEVINSVRVMQPQQVMLEVRFVEASRTAGRELGINWNVIARNASAATGAFAGGGLGAIPIALASGNTPFGLAIGRMVGNGVEVDTMIQALEGKGLVRRLAEPNLIALSGDTASFLAGGEFPIPVASNRDTITVEWKRYGVGLAFTPTVLQNGVINLKIEPEVSQLDAGNVIQIGGLRLPSLTVRRANTTIELRDGQSFAIAGLLQSIDTSDQKQFPWLGDVPVIGPLLRSTQYQKQETDLAIIVTPHLVRPTRPAEQLKTPLDNTVAGNDADLFIKGRAELTPRQLGDEVPAARPIRPLGHILDLPKGAS
ncbi:MAG: type II and III secretion system protein family protein [Xanthobacteraceae bacterium]